MASKDVELRIKARDAASANVKKISDALKLLSGESQDAAKGSNKLAGSLGSLTDDVAKLQRGMDRIKAVGQIATQFDKTAASVDRLETSVRGTATELAKIARETEQATQAASRFQAQLASEQSALNGSKSALAAARKEQAEYNKLIRDGEAAQKSLNAMRSNRAGGNVATSGVGRETGAPVSSARASMGAFVAADLAANRAAQAKVNAEVKNHQRAIEGSTAAIKELRPQASAAAAQQAKLAEETTKASTSLRRQREDLAGQRTELASIGGAVQTASGAMGGMVVSQEAVAKSAERMAAQLAQAKAQIATLSEVKAPVAGGQDLTGTAKENAARREAVTRLRELRKELAASQADAQRLNQAMRSTSQPTEAMGAAVGRAQQTVRNLKTELADLTGRLRTSGGGFKEFEQRVREIQGSAAKATTANTAIAASAERAGSGQRSLAPQVRSTGNAMGDAANKTNTFNGALLGLGDGTRQSLSLMQRLRGEILSLAAAYASFQGAVSSIGSSLAAYRQLEAAQSRLGVVFDQDTTRVSQEIDFLRQTADTLGVSFGTLADEYGKFAVAADSANFTVDETRKVFLSVAEAGRVNKLSQDQLSGTFLALTQMMSKGKVTAEELRGQLGERLTGAFNIFADALGLSTAELNKMMEQGEILADRSTMLAFANELTERFGPQLAAALDSVSTDIGRFENDINRAQLTLAQGFIPGLRSALQSFNEFANSSEGRLFFTELGVSVGKFISVLAEVPKHFEMIKGAMQAFIAVKLGGFLVETVRRVGEVRMAMVGLSQQMAFVGPQMQQITIGQRVLGQGFAQVVGKIDTYRASLVRSTAMTGSSRVGTLAFAASLGVVRSAMVMTATAARALWAAFGGIPGLIAAGITFAVGGWFTGVDKASSALVEHQRQLDLVKKAYADAGGNLDDWAKKISGILPVALAEKDFQAQVELYDRGFDKVESRVADLRLVFDDFQNGSQISDDYFVGGRLGEIEGMIGAVDELGRREITVEEFNRRLNDLQQATTDAEIRQFATDLLEAANATDENGDSLAAFGQRIDAAATKLRQARGEIIETTEATEETNKVFDQTASLAKYTEAIDILKGKLPELSAEMKHLAELAEINSAAFTAMSEAVKMGDFGMMAQAFSLWSQNFNAIQAGQVSGAVNGSLVDKIIGVESAGNANAKNPNSSATGLGQFIESTWLDMFKKYFPEIAAGMSNAAILEKRTDPTISREMVDLYAQENARFLQQFGLVINDANLYLAHFLGPQGAQKLLQASPGTPVSQILEPGQISANGSILEGKNAGQVIAWAQQKMGITTQELAVRERMSELDQEALDKTLEQNTATQERLTQGEFEIEQQKLIQAGKEREAEVQAAIAAARAENPAITEAEIEQIRLQTEELYNLKNAVDEKAAAEERVNQLYQLRQQLLEQMRMAQEMGDQTQALNLETRIGEVNLQLDGAIQKAIAMWQAVGGPEADAAIAKLQTLGMSVQNVGTKMSFLGLSMQQWGNLAGSFADGIVGTLDSFAQAIVNGSNAVAELGKAFLQFAADFLRQIAAMILKQVMFNMLQSLFPGLPIGHTGGVVGTKAIGGGNGRIANTGWMQQALTYHTGGVAGLKPDEVNATLRVGEEILTEEDPRHRNNAGREDQGGPAGAGQQQALKQVLVFDPSEISAAMTTKHGESAIMTVIRSNRSTLRQILGS
ncbi:MAG: tape measure protein [Candidatus Devosia phytovorans]|uniref:Tape measure protein n=1 Tax=Candidatus Devosia phytovorans TaxID=3121372 RepID=A0AAJ6AZN1_9HYPH|nr:tape measure protein [Devosia sp.]WEK03264.1 MAG: tape measure protein [Devosia sp.]